MTWTARWRTSLWHEPFASSAVRNASLAFGVALLLPISTAAQVQSLSPRSSTQGSVQALPIEEDAGSVYAIGTAQITLAGTQAARTAALRAAYAEAVARGAGLQIDSMTVVRDVRHVVDVVTSRSSGFITAYGAYYGPARR